MASTQTAIEHEISAKGEAKVVAWDLPIRLFHWTLVALLIFAWVSYRYAEDMGDYLLKMHRWNGLAILTLLFWRVMWGFAGSSTARFANFVKGPITAIGYGRDLVTGGTRRFLGHNPLGAAMVMVMLAVVLAQAMLGLFTVEHNGLTAGPLYRLVEESTRKWASHLHSLNFWNVMLPLIGLHIAANIFYALVKREPLIPAMFSGRKPKEAYADAPRAEIPARPMLRAAVLLALAALIVLGTIRLLAGRLI
ncbi:MAG: cytochrome b/b6 domain-containing protein [Hyphomicrobiaceae bacterium]|nr:cytochrome b/b6 domain-containing protein [Hyphomicrobiaceae bacterium]MCC0010908.1 cytochrome b/b6 domain-containing protein [Hyphomicrobiaceae bacterium]